MSLLQIVNVRRVSANGEPWDMAFKPGFNLIVGNDSTSKTTTLRIIDHCLGDGVNSKDKFGQAIDEDYAAFELTINANGREHRLVRSLRGSAHRSAVEIEGTYYSRDNFNEWIRNELDWPQVSIPQGRSFATATSEQRITFRAVYRHLFRKDNSWTCFASKEEEYWRQAVVAFLLGVAQQVYHGNWVQITRSEERIRELEARRVELRATLDDVTRTITASPTDTNTVGVDSLPSAIVSVSDELRAIEASRQLLLESLHGDPRYDERQDSRLSAMSREIRSLDENCGFLRGFHREHTRMLAALEADDLRISRALEAVDVFSPIAVTVCPVCTQSLEGVQRQGAEADCRVCGQVVAPDLWSRRLELEQRAIRQERAELERVSLSVAEGLLVAEQRVNELHQQRESLLRLIDEERQALVAPLLRDFEALQVRIGQLQQRRDMLTSLLGLQSRVEAIDQERARVEGELAELRARASTTNVDRGLIVSRTNRLAFWMNEFIDRLSLPKGIGSSVTIDRSDFGFLVGRDSWDRVLGAERVVVFLLAYHYAYLRLASEEDILHPRIAILDNPFQQDLRDEVVVEALSLIAECCREVPDSQVIVCTSKSLPELEAHRIELMRQFDPEPSNTNRSRLLPESPP